MLPFAQSYQEACRTFRWKIPDLYNLAFDLCDRQTLGGADGHRTALIVEQGDGPASRYSFVTLLRLARRMGAVFQALGLQAGDRIAVSLPQSLEAAVCLLAVPRMGAVLVPLPMAMMGAGLVECLAASGAKAIVAAPAIAQEARVLGTAMPHLISVGGGEGTIDFWAALDAISAEASAQATRADDPAVLIYAGTHVPPGQGVLHAHRAVLGNLPAVEFALDFFARPGDVLWTAWDWMSFEGLFWALLPAWHHGVPVVAAPAFHPNGALDWIAANGVRVAVLGPDHLAALAEAAIKRSHSALRVIASGPDPLSPELQTLVEAAFGLTANEIWGAADIGALAANNATVMERRPGSPGRAAPGLTVEAADATSGRVLPAGVPGRLASAPKAPGHCLGVWDGRVLTPAGGGLGGGWRRTGWTGLRDLDGYLFPDPRPGVVMPTPNPPPAPSAPLDLKLGPVTPDDRW